MEDPFSSLPLLSSPRPISPSPAPGSSRKVRVKVEPETPSKPGKAALRSLSPPSSQVVMTPPPSGSNFYVVTQGINPGIYDNWCVWFRIILIFISMVANAKTIVCTSGMTRKQRRPAFPATSLKRILVYNLRSISLTRLRERGGWPSWAPDF